MSEYSNGFSINVSDIARISFREQVNDQIKETVHVSMHYEVFKKLYEVMGTTITEHDIKLAKLIEAKQELN